MKENNDDPIDDSSLEKSSSAFEESPAEKINNPDGFQSTTDTDATQQGRLGGISQLFEDINPYIILYIAIVVVAIIIFFVATYNTTSEPLDSDITIEGQELDQAALDNLISQESTIGTVSQTLTVAANSIFNGNVLVKDNLDVAGSINVGGPLSLPGITVAGDSSFENVEVSNNLTINGSATVQGALNAQQNLNVSGDASIAGALSAASITADTIEFLNDVAILRHIDTGGPTPAISRGTSVGNGGTVSISGGDVSGSVNINTGSGASAGILASITFAAPYNNTPHVVISPVGSATSTLAYYVTRTSSGFSIGTTSSPAGSQNYVFDYVIME